MNNIIVIFDMTNILKEHFLFLSCDLMVKNSLLFF